MRILINLEKLSFVIIGIFLFACTSNKEKQNNPISLDKFADGIHHWFLFADNTNYKRFAADDYTSIADKIIRYQNPDGGWPKNIDWLANVDADSLKATRTGRQLESTFDNDNTHPQIDFLAKMYVHSGKEEYKYSTELGLVYILNSQNPSGGWRGWDVDAITYNDNVTNGIMDLLLDIRENQPQWKWLGNDLRIKLDSSLEKAIDVTLKCQIVTNGVKTAWCQQHDHHTFLPVKARTYELPSIASRESVEIIRFLMRLPKDTVVVEAIEAAVHWLVSSKIYNLKVVDIPIPADTYPGQNLSIDRKVVIDSTAPAIWARFYEVSDNTPFMCTRQGKKVYKLSDVNPERRGGYAWYGYWPQELLSKEYAEWKERDH